MAQHDGQDPDRAAIMARRQRFVALALGGLATSCTPGKSGSDPITSGESDTLTTRSDSSESGSETRTDSGAPAPCLSFDLPSEEESGSEESGSEESGSEESGSEESGSEESGSETGRPQPCLAPPGLHHTPKFRD